MPKAETQGIRCPRIDAAREDYATRQIAAHATAGVGTHSTFTRKKGPDQGEKYINQRKRDVGNRVVAGSKPV